MILLNSKKIFFIINLKYGSTNKICSNYKVIVQALKTVVLRNYHRYLLHNKAIEKTHLPRRNRLRLFSVRAIKHFKQRIRKTYTKIKYGTKNKCANTAEMNFKGNRCNNNPSITNKCNKGTTDNN